MADNRRFYEAGTGRDARKSAPAAQRNRDPIADVLADWLPPTGTVLEVASGTGEHATYFAERFPALDWQPSDIHADALASIEAYGRRAGLSNLRTPLRLDAAAPGEWPLAANVILSINMVHISPWAAALGLLDGAQRLLHPGGPLILYGPWLTDLVQTAPSNLAFDADLKRRDPEWGLRRVEDFVAAAQPRGLELEETRAMPANNMMLLLRKT